MELALSVSAGTAPVVLPLRCAEAPPSRLSWGKSEAPATRTSASACLTRSVATARSGLPASASVTSEASSGELKLVHQVGVTPTASAGADSFQLPATGTSGSRRGLTIAQPERLTANVRAITRGNKIFIVVTPRPALRPGRAPRLGEQEDSRTRGPGETHPRRPAGWARSRSSRRSKKAGSPARGPARPPRRSGHPGQTRRPPPSGTAA